MKNSSVSSIFRFYGSRYEMYCERLPDFGILGQGSAMYRYFSLNYFALGMKNVIPEQNCIPRWFTQRNRGKSAILAFMTARKRLFLQQFRNKKSPDCGIENWICPIDLILHLTAPKTLEGEFYFLASIPRYGLKTVFFFPDFFRPDFTQISPKIAPRTLYGAIPLEEYGPGEPTHSPRPIRGHA